MASEIDTASGDAWTSVPRRRFESLWGSLPALTVLTTVPGGGRTEWMRQCRAHLEAQGARTAWISSSHDLTAALADHASSPTVMFVDDVALSPNDDRWEQLAEWAGGRVVVAASDAPATSASAALVLHEGDLRLDDDEVRAIIAANGVVVAPDARDELTTRLKGWPSLVRAQIERLRARSRQKVWASVAPPLEHIPLGAILAARGDAESGFSSFLRRAGAYRRFSVRLLSRGDGARESDATHFDRLCALPFGTTDIDDETGEWDYVWTDTAWRTLVDAQPAEVRAQDVAVTLPRLASDGRATARLFPLLALDRLEEADALVFDHHRRFLVFTDAPTQEALLAQRVTAEHPSLLLLTIELRLRTTGAHADLVRDARRCLHAFTARSHDDELRRFRLACRRAMAAAYAGERSETVRQLDTISDVLDVDAGSSVRRAADRSASIAARVAADLFLAFWAAVQTDRHDLALDLVDASQRYSDPADPVTQIDRLTAMTEEDFAGTRSTDPECARPPALQFSHAAALVLIEEGEDDEAIERTHPIASRVRPAPTRSAADALLVLSRALVAPAHLDRGLVDGVVRLSATFWDDGEPSTFIAFSAVVAHLAADRVPDARAVARSVTAADWFTLAAQGLIALRTAAPASALPSFSAASDATRLPRLRVTAAVLHATALAVGGLDDAAAARLQSTWRVLPAPRLFRFALRLLHVDEFAALQRAAGETVIGRVLSDAAGDPRPDPRRLRTVSAAERDILMRLQRGESNATIALDRGVSLNTVRTQLRLLYRKLDATDRAGAVGVAERLRLIDDVPS